MNEFEASGIVKNDATMHFHEVNDLNTFLSHHKGHRFTIQIRVQEKDKSKEFLAYYWHVVVPKMKRAFFEIGYYYRKKEAVDLECRKLCGIYHEIPKEDMTGYSYRLKTISEMGTTELYNYIELLKIYAAENLSVYIDDPITF